MARDITITDAGNSRIKFEHDDGVTPDWFVNLANAHIGGSVDGGATAANNANRIPRGPFVLVTQSGDQGKCDKIYLKRIKAAGAFAAWTPGDTKTHLESFMDILEAIA